MPRASHSRGFWVILAGYIAGAAWFSLNPALTQAARSPELASRALIAFLLPTAAAVLLWLFHAIESRRPVCVREPGDCTATERILFRFIVFLGGLHALVMLLIEAPWIPTSAPHLPLVLVGALLVSIGNLLPTTRPNALVGIRTARSLRSRPFWIEINRVAGYITVAVGVVMMVAAVSFSSPLAGHVTGVAVLAAVGILSLRYRSLARHAKRA